MVAMIRLGKNYPHRSRADDRFSRPDTRPYLRDVYVWWRRCLE
jgi:hypothetical protein